MFLAVTRGLFPAPSLPCRDDFEWESFHWHKFCRDIPCGCHVFTDRSLLDGRLPKGCQSLGWAFVVISKDGDFIASAYGVPPKWVDTIQGAELWAVRMALLHAVFPERLYTDCDSVRAGVAKGPAWARSSKRRYARVWTALSLQLEDVGDIVHWMPAHTSASAVGQKVCSDGTPMSEDMWCSNQIADQLAKDAAEAVRLSASQRWWLLDRERQLTELVIFLGRLTHVAGSCVMADRSTRRDSTAVKSFRRAVKVPNHSGTVTAPKQKARVAKSRSGGWKMPGRVGPFVSARAPNVSRAGRVKRAGDGISARSEASFKEWWREERGRTLKPRDESLPSASGRLAALRDRLFAKTAAASSSG